MAQQTFPISGKRPKVMITGIEGALTVRSWERQEIGVGTGDPIEVLRQEGNTLTITGCKGDLELWIPFIANRLFSTIVTDIVGTGLGRDVTIERAGNVSLKDVGGGVTLEEISGDVELVNLRDAAELSSIGGNLRAAHMPRLHVQQGLGGNGTLLDLGHVDIDKVGGNLWVTRAETVTVDTVGGELDLEGVDGVVRCRAVGGNCEERNSPHAEMIIHMVGGNMLTEGASLMGSCTVGGNMRVRANATSESEGRFRVGGNAIITLPEDANLTVRGCVGGNASGPAAVYSRGGGFLNLVYGEGAASLALTVGGNVKLLGATPQRSGNGGAASWQSFGAEMASFGMEMGSLGRKIGHDFLRSLDQ